MVTAADGVCTHLRLLPLVLVLRDGDGDFERVGEVKSRGCWRVETMVYGVWRALMAWMCVFGLSVKGEYQCLRRDCERNRAWRGRSILAGCDVAEPLWRHSVMALRKHVSLINNIIYDILRDL